MKNNRNNVTCTTEREKSKKYYVRNHTILLVCLRGAVQKYLFCNYQSLTFLKKIHST